ncbi:MAG: DnaT-like ssDNA-binding domain-containing protein [Leclercia adecarboxylata]|nr:DnaT-like ssDNA-binding domain-containing protein [Leclercia adecarboxylata]
MTATWLPSRDFRQRAATWGIALPDPDYLPTELAEFASYWESEGKVFTQVQWEQKFARHIVLVRSKKQPETGGKANAGVRGEPTASRAVQQIQSAHAEWRRRNGLDGNGNGMAPVAGHGGSILEPVDAEEWGGTFAALDSPDRFDD